jgi:hypothetical protein
MRFQVFTSMKVWIIVFWVVTPDLENGDDTFIRNFSSHPQDYTVSQSKISQSVT